MLNGLGPLFEHLFGSTLDILLTISNFAAICQLTVIRLLVDCLFNIYYILMPPQQTLLTISNLATTSQLVFLARTLTPNHKLTVY